MQCVLDDVSGARAYIETCVNSIGAVQAARDGWHAHEGAADSGGTSKSASSGSGAQPHVDRSGRSESNGLAAAAQAAMPLLPRHGVDAAMPRDSLDSLGAPTPTRAPSTNLDMRDIKLYREADGRPVLLGRGSHAKVDTWPASSPFSAPGFRPSTCVQSIQMSMDSAQKAPVEYGQHGWRLSRRLCAGSELASSDSWCQGRPERMRRPANARPEVLTGALGNL